MPVEMNDWMKSGEFIKFLLTSIRQLDAIFAKTDNKKATFSHCKVVKFVLRHISNEQLPSYGNQMRVDFEDIFDAIDGCFQ